MIFTTSLRQRTSSVFSIGRRDDSRFLSGSATPLGQASVARAFYCDVLRGRQLWDEAREHDGNLSFIVNGTRIDFGASAASDREPVVVHVPDPAAVAERCWDAGYSVRVERDDESTAEATVSVIDPFGRRIDLVR